MATKKNTTSKNTTSKKNTTTKKNSTRGKNAPPPRKVRRELWAVLFVLLAIVSLLSLFGFSGALLGTLRTALGALIGVGLYVLPLALLALAVLFIVQRKGPVRLRACCVALLPLLVSALLHAIFNAHAYPMEMGTLSALLSSGMRMQSGGLLGGMLYLLLEWSISAIGAVLVLCLLLIITLMIALRITPAMLWHMCKAPTYEYEDDEERARYEAPPTLPNLHEAAAKRALAKQQKRTTRQQIDIPLDGEPIKVTPSKAASPSAFVEDVPLSSAPTTPADAPVHDSPAASSDFTDSSAPAPAPTPAAQDSFSDILRLVQKAQPLPQSEVTEDAPPWEASKPDKKQEAAMAQALADEITANQNAPVPAYVHPPLHLLNPATNTGTHDAKKELHEASQRLIDTLESFGIDAQIIHIVRGPSVTRFELTIERGVKFSRITALSDDIALSLGAVSVRIAAIPDKVAVGIEVPNKSTDMVCIREVLGSRAFQAAKSQLSFCVGKDITGAAVIGDIAKMPHMLIAGTTGSGKSVCINSLLISMLYKSSPEQVRLIMIDPKMVELGNYNGIPHLLVPVVTDPKKASGALSWAVGEMERRYKLFAENGVRNLVGYNDVMRQKKAEAARTEGGTPEVYTVLAQIVIVIDELADLMMVAAKEVETSICRIAQKARAAGMHLVVATQRPSADVITGIMKANIPSRIAFAVASQMESRIILDTNGAEKLIGKGDMLYAPLGEGKPTRVQGCYISNDEIEAVIANVKEGATVEYSEEIMEHIEKAAETGGGGGSATGDAGEDEDEMLFEAIDVIIDSRQASVSLLQRRLKLGYSRAARIVDQMEERGIVGASEGSKPRQILISRDEWQEMKLRRNI